MAFAHSFPAVVTPLLEKRGEPRVDFVVVTYGDVGGEPRAAAQRQLLVHEVEVERVLGGEGGHEAEPLPECHPDV